MIFIPGNVASSKNSRVFNIKARRSFSSKQTQRYIKNSQFFWNRYRGEFKKLIENCDKPYMIGFHFVRDSKRLYDFVNPVQTVQDIMKSSGWIEDDNVEIMYPAPLKVNGHYTTYDKNNPGVYIDLIKI
jgi:hypothetical protein